MTRRSKPTPIRLKTYVYRGLLHCGECGCGITMETQKGHNYLRCTKRVKQGCSQPYLREEALTDQIAAVLDTLSLPDETADWLITEVEKARQRENSIIEDARKKIQADIAKLDNKLDRLTSAYLDAGAFSAAEFRKRKAETIEAKKKLQENNLNLERGDVERFEPLKRFVNGSKQMKYVASRRNPQELRQTLEQVGSNLQLNNRRLNWEPRGAWQLVVDKGSFAHGNAAPEISGAASCGKTRLYPNESGRRESNPHGHFCPTDFKSVASAVPPRPVCARRRILSDPPGPTKKRSTVQHHQREDSKDHAVPAKRRQTMMPKIAHQKSRAQIGAQPRHHR